MDAPSAAFLSALERSRALGSSFAATLSDVNAANELLWVEARGNGRLQQSTTYDGLRMDALTLARMPTGDPQRQGRVDELFQQLVALIEAHAPGLLVPRHFWTNYTCGLSHASPVRTASELACFRLASGEPLSLATLGPEDVQALTAFFEGLSADSFKARFPQQACRRDQLASQMVLDCQHPMPDRRHVTLLLHDEAKRIVGVLDYHQRPESMMRHAVQTAQAAGQPLPRLGLKTCELNVVIADALQGQGLGQRLLAFGMADASRAGHQQLVVVVATANQPMQRRLAQMGASPGAALLDRGYELYVLNSRALMA